MDEQRLRQIYKNMLWRCYNDLPIGYASNPYYRDKGIKVCDQWRCGYSNFRDWAMQSGYKDDLTIDRIDNLGDYSPENCRWVTKSENSRRVPHDPKSAVSGGYVFCLGDIDTWNPQTYWIKEMGLSARMCKKRMEDFRRAHGNSFLVMYRKTRKDDYIGKQFLVYQEGYNER